MRMSRRGEADTERIMIHSLQQLIVSHAPACIAVVSLLGGLALSGLLYGRRHEQRTRDRGSVP